MEKKLVKATNNNLRVARMIELGVHEIRKNPHLAQKYFLDALDIIELSSYKQKGDQQARLYNLMGILHRRSRNYSLSLDYYNKALNYYESTRDTLNLSKVYHRIGNLYRHSEDNLRAITNFRKSIHLKKKFGNIHQLANSYHKIGIAFSKMSVNSDSTIFYYTRANELFKIIGNEESIHKVKHWMACFYLKKKRFKKAKNLLLKNLEYYKRKGDKKGESRTEHFISYMYKEQIESGFSKDYDKGLYHAQNSLSTAKIIGNDRWIARALKLKTFFYLKKQDYKKAIESNEEYDLQKNKMYNQSETEKIELLKIHFEFREQRKELELIADRERSLRVLYVIIFVITMLGSLIIGFFIRKNILNKVKISSEKLEKEKIKKQLLEQQIKASDAEIKFLISDNKMKLLSKKELLEQLKDEESLAPSLEIKQFLRSLISKINQQLIVENKLLTIQSKMEELDKGFDSKIRTLYPSLTKNEREVCTLLRLNLSIKEIVSVKNTTVDSIKSIRYRIRKKMGLSPGEELEKRIQDI